MIHYIAEKNPQQIMSLLLMLAIRECYWYISISPSVLINLFILGSMRSPHVSETFLNLPFRRKCWCLVLW